MITIQSPTACSLDGQNLGAVCDSIANNPALAADIQRALVAYDAALRAEQSAALSAAQTDKAEALASLAAEHATALAEAVAAKEAAETALADNVAYQTRALDFAKEVIGAGELERLPEVLAFAGASFAERERAEKLAKAAALKAEAEALELAANS